MADPQRRRLPWRCVLALLAAAAIVPPARAADPPATGTLVELSAEATRSAPNDLARATAYTEVAEATPGEAAKRVNAAIAQALQTAKGHPAVRVKSGNTSTYPVYAKGSSRIEAWRMRAELVLETRDTAALSELLGRLQGSLAVGQISLSPAPETRRKVEEETMLEAIANFRARAKLVAEAFGRPMRIRSLSVGGAARPGPHPVLRAAMAEAAAPIEAGESQIAVAVSGQIELLAAP